MAFPLTDLLNSCAKAVLLVYTDSASCFHTALNSGQLLLWPLNVGKEVFFKLIFALL